MRSLRHVHDWLRGSPSGLVALALAIGAGAGVGAVGFRYLILGFTYVFTRPPRLQRGRAAPYGFLSRRSAVVCRLGAGRWRAALRPADSRFAREARGHGVPR